MRHEIPLEGRIPFPDITIPVPGQSRGTLN